MTNKSRSAEIAARFVDRAKQLGLKGKARDRAALEFMMGAAQALDIAKVVDGGVTMSAFMTATRGYSFVEEIAKEAPQEGAK